jgi:hypothetical protein
MRCFLILFFAPAFCFASCPVGNNYGSRPINSPERICMAYSGSSLGGCIIECSAICLKIPKDNPTDQTPYVSSGQECKTGDGGGDGGGGGKPDPDPDKWNPSVSPFPTVSSSIRVGGDHQEMTTSGLNVLDSSIKTAANFTAGQLKGLGGVVGSNSAELRKVADALSTQSNLASANGRIFGEIKSDTGHIRQTNTLIANCFTNPHENCSDFINSSPDYSFNLGQIQNTLNSMVNSNLRVVSNTDGLWMKIHQVGQNTETIAGNTAYTNGLLENIEKLLREGNGNGGGEGGDKPCKGPLCDFTKPPVGSGSALSKVFSAESVDEVKKQVEIKDAEIKTAMNDVKSVFAPEQLTINGTYNNDYHDINGVRVDLSGKSNMELFFNSGPKMAIWFLAVLLAFSILMGGRKNA